MKKVIEKFLAANGYGKITRTYPKSYSILNSKEFVLEDKVGRSEIENFLKSLKPFDVGIDLIRLGSNGDGGYLVPDDLDGIDACFSPGVSKISTFEKDCYDRGMKLFLADKSVQKADLDVEHQFLPKYIGCTNNDTFITMPDWVKRNVSDQDELMLQMDIEGAEYMTLINMPDELINRFRVVVIEFHNLHKLWSKFAFEIIHSAFEKLLKSHTIVHIHPNNCCGVDTIDGIEIPRVMEFSFIRNDRFKEKKGRSDFPHPLDFDNTDYPTINLPQSWYQD